MASTVGIELKEEQINYLREVGTKAKGKKAVKINFQEVIKNMGFNIDGETVVWSLGKESKDKMVPPIKPRSRSTLRMSTVRKSLPTLSLSNRST